MQTNQQPGDLVSTLENHIKATHLQDARTSIGYSWQRRHNGQAGTYSILHANTGERYEIQTLLDIDEAMMLLDFCHNWFCVRGKKKEDSFILVKSSSVESSNAPMALCDQYIDSFMLGLKNYHLPRTYKKSEAGSILTFSIDRGFVFFLFYPGVTDSSVCGLPRYICCVDVNNDNWAVACLHDPVSEPYYRE